MVHSILFLMRECKWSSNLSFLSRCTHIPTFKVHTPNDESRWFTRLTGAVQWDAHRSLKVTKKVYNFFYHWLCWIIHEATCRIMKKKSIGRDSILSIFDVLCHCAHFKKKKDENVLSTGSKVSCAPRILGMLLKLWNFAGEYPFFLESNFANEINGFIWHCFGCCWDEVKLLPLFIP